MLKGWVGLGAGGVGEEGAEVLEGGVEEFLFGFGEVAGGFDGEHFEGVDDGACGAEVDLFFSGVWVWDLAEEESGVLGLEDDEFVESGIGGRGVGHGRSFLLAGVGCKREDWGMGRNRGDFPHCVVCGVGECCGGSE